MNVMTKYKVAEVWKKREMEDEKLEKKNWPKDNRMKNGEEGTQGTSNDGLRKWERRRQVFDWMLV